MTNEQSAQELQELGRSYANELVKAREARKLARLNCRDGKHLMQPTTSAKYRQCSLCKYVEMVRNG